MSNRICRAWLCSIICITACSDARSGTRTNPDLAMSLADMGSSAPPAVIYGHSDSTLYTVDPDTLKVTLVADFIWPMGSDQMTDIALDRDGNMIGISFDSVYAVDKATAKCTYLAPFHGLGITSLSFIYAKATDGNEMLVGADSQGSFWRIDPMTGSQSQIGAYGGGWVSSGDIVSVQGATYATVRSGFDTIDSLVSVDPTTGQATLIGSTGVSEIWGLAYWKQKLFGFTGASGLVTIDITTGKATAVAGANVPWYGAGVTTAAPITVQ